MNSTRKTLEIFLLIVIIYNLVHIASPQENGTKEILQKESETIKTQNVNFLESSQSGVEKEDIILDQKNIDRTLNILNIVATLMGVLVGILTLIVAIFGALGFFEKVKISDISLTEKQSKEIKEKLDEVNRRSRLFEILGVSLKSEDYYTRGITHYYNDESELALKAFEEAIKIKPDYAKAWVNKSVTLGDLGQYEEALEAAEKAIEIEPEDTDAWNNKSAALYKLGRYEEALEAAEKAIEIKPDNANAWSNKSGVLYCLRRYEEAVKASNKAIEIKPKQAILWYNHACVYSIKREKETVLHSLKKAIEIDVSFKEKAINDKDFEWLRDDEDFQKVVK